MQYSIWGYNAHTASMMHHRSYRLILHKTIGSYYNSLYTHIQIRDIIQPEICTCTYELLEKK